VTHLTALQLSMYADNALSADETSAATGHIESCASCQSRLAAVRDEARIIASALRVEASGDSREAAIPRFARPASLRGFALANLATGLVIWLAQFLWKTLFGELVVNATSWVTSIYLPDIYAMASAAALYLLKEGTAMFDAYLGLVVASLFTLTGLWLLLIYRRARTTVGVCLLVITAGTLAVPVPANALDFRRDEDLVTIARSETVDDTLLVAAETVLVDGVVTGDLVVVGHRIEISGSVEGNLLAFGESVIVRGKVGGLALSVASSYDLRGATVGGDLWVAGDKVEIGHDARVRRNASVLAETATVEGAVDKDLYTIADTMELSGILGGNLEAFGDRLRLLGDAQIGGNVRFRTRHADRLHRADTVRVAGEVEFLDLPRRFQASNRYATVEFYLWQVARLVGAFVVGSVFLWLLPRCRSMSIAAGIDGLKTAGVGFLTLVSVPIVAVLAAFTLVGLPLSLIAIAAWMVMVYLAKVVVGLVVGRMLLNESASFAVTLLAGLAIVIVAVNLPYLGGIINFVLTIVGLGLLAQYLIAVLPAGEPGDLTPA